MPGQPPRSETDPRDARDHRIAQLERRLETQGTIERAVGVLMERHHLDADAAAARLERAAALQGQPVLLVATRLLEPRTPGPAAGPAPADGPLAPATRGATVPAAEDTVEAFGLSERETQVLTLVGRGATNLEISSTLFIGLNTVKTYIRTAYRKIGATRRSQAVIWCHQYGLVEPPVPQDRRV